MNPDKIKESLLEEGLEEKDIITALQIAACIGRVNEICFQGDNIPLEFSSTKPSDIQDSLVRYCPSEKNPQESYIVFMRGITKEIDKMLSKHTILFQENGRLIKESPSIKQEEALLKIAIHEVRHRLQNKKEVAMFSAKNIKKLDNPLRGIARFTKNLMKIMKEDAQKEGVNEDALRYYESQEEFDARVVEYYAQNKIHKGLILEEFFNLARVKPKK